MSCTLWKEAEGSVRTMVRAQFTGDNLSGDVVEGAPLFEWDCVCGERHHDIPDRAPWRFP